MQKIRVKRDPIYGSDPYAYKFDRRLVDNLLPRKVKLYFNTLAIFTKTFLIKLEILYIIFHTSWVSI